MRGAPSPGCRSLSTLAERMRHVLVVGPAANERWGFPVRTRASLQGCDRARRCEELVRAPAHAPRTTLSPVASHHRLPRR